MRILISNDDGIQAKGICELAKSLSKKADVYVVAPETQQSARGQAVSLRSKLLARKINMKGTVSAIALNGTPTDCIKFGIFKMKEKGIEPDIVISGINMGANVGADIHYSGTVAAASEGALNGYHSIALSVASHSASHYEYICNMLPDLIHYSRELPTGVILNVNTPDIPYWEIKGVRFISGTAHRGWDVLKKSDDSDEEESYCYTGTQDDQRQTEEDDLEAIRNGFATIAPLTINHIDHRMLYQLRKIASKKPLVIMLDLQENALEKMNKSKRLMEHLVMLAKCTKKLGLPVLVTEQYSRKAGPFHNEIKTELEGYEKIEKLQFDCSDSEEFASFLQTSISKEIVLAGIETHISVLQTAKYLLANGYHVTVLQDCCGSRYKEDKTVALRQLEKNGCTITTCEAYMYEIVGSTTDFSCRALEKIFK